MSARELTITLLGLVATFCMPWPGGPEQGDDEALGPFHAYSASATPCIRALPAVVAVRTSELPLTPPELAQAAVPR